MEEGEWRGPVGLDRMIKGAMVLVPSYWTER